MAPKFGTSGLRGLVVELTPELVADYTRAFLSVCPTDVLIVGRDLRESSPAIAAEVIRAAQGQGVEVTDLGALPTPALALISLGRAQPAIMVTGSHIPADRNGLKFYTQTGEIAKDHEVAITAALGRATKGLSAKLTLDDSAVAAYVARYVDAFGAEALKGLRIGVWQHSSVARDVLMDVLQACGAEPVALGRSEVFIPVDTEAVDAETRGRLAAWAAEHKLDAIVSTDGDADRPMLADATGLIIPGDVLGTLVSQYLGAELVVTPVSSNTSVDLLGKFKVLRTKIGSPFVIAAMEEALADPAAKVVGYEANGGFLLGYQAGALAPLMTRDCTLPILAPLAAAKAAGLSIGDFSGLLPPRFTASDRLQEIEPSLSRAFIAALAADAAVFLAEVGLSEEAKRDETDGLRITSKAGEIIHLRPSGNAPEFRVYAEADSPQRAAALLAKGLAAVGQGVKAFA